MIKYVTDSSCDAFSWDGENLEVVSLTIDTAERSFVDSKELNTHEMLEYLLTYKNRSYTACPSTESWLKAFEGGDEIYVVTMTSFLSGTYNSACLARDLYLEKHPESKIAVIDTLTTGPEMHLIVEKVIEWKKSGRSFEDISDKIYQYISSTRLFFAFQSLHNFAQNGRVSKVIASAVGMLNIRILGTASIAGNIQPMYKCRGDKNTIAKLVSELHAAGFHGGKLRICHIENETLAQQVGQAIQEGFPQTDLLIYPARGICSYYGERGGIILGIEC